MWILDWVWVWVWIKDLLLVSCGLGKQDFMSHEKWRELQLSDILLSSLTGYGLWVDIN